MHRKQIFRIAILLISLAVLILPLCGYAQTSSLNAFSPYTMYGLGDLRMQGNAEMRIMGGAGVAYRNFGVINYLNPASLSAIPQHSAIFNFGVEGQNYYSKTSYTSTAKNNFNMHDVALAFPLAKGVGFGVSLTPFSSVGYETNYINDDPSVIEDVGRAVYGYRGEGGISQITGTIGVEVAKNLSLGANVIYYFGSLDRFYNADITSMIAPVSYNSVRAYSKIHVSSVNYSVGVQYQVRVGRYSGLTFGATFQPKLTINTKENREQVSIRSTTIDTISMSRTPYQIIVPAKFEAGISYNSRKIVLLADYSRQNWKDALTIKPGENISAGVQQQVRLGFSYTPNYANARTASQRWSYRLGLRYGTTYLKYDGEQLKDYAVSLGMVVPFKREKISRVTIGAEFGQRGTTKGKQIRDRYINIFAGFSLFGEIEDQWFRRQKFN